MPPCYETTIFFSAGLLFVNPPTTSKRLLPLFGATLAYIHSSLFLLLQLTLRVDLPFLIIASRAPLLQRWLAEADHFPNMIGLLKCPPSSCLIQ